MKFFWGDGVRIGNDEGMNSSRLDWRAIVNGGVMALVIAIPFSIAARAADGEGVAVLWVLGAVGGLAFGAALAGWAQHTGFPVLNGVVAATCAYAVAQAVFIVVRLITEREVRWLSAFFNLTVASVAGVIGGALGAFMLSRGARPRP